MVSAFSTLSAFRMDSPASEAGFISMSFEGYNQERPYPSHGYATPAAFSTELDKQLPASTALMRKTTARL
ncbi:hypothetical protein [Novosphingobium sp.]|uniref:hypothetical protein n=1 Tax=Novosphingobium sp. TaxID=1874826 RepID=UPI00260B2FB2|nr:hypothetical protein [Novosphingobium sp.]